jgi:hypothetical protein
MSNKDDHLIYESYIRPIQQGETDDILLETIDHIITALEGHGMLKIVARPDRGAINKILKQRHAKSKSDEGEDREDEDKEDFKTRLLRAIAQAGDADLNMPFEEKEKPDLNGDGENDFEDVKIARQNAAAKASSKSK